MRKKLELFFNPSDLEIKDESHLHVGHAGYQAGKSTHFRVKIKSDRFKGLSRIQQHRLVYDLLDHEMKTEIHALAIQSTLT